MAKDSDAQDRFLHLWDRFPVLLFGAIVVCTIVFAVGYYVDHLLTDLESQLVFVPPRDHAPPNLDEFDAGGVTPDQLPNQHSVYVPAYSHIYSQGGSPYQLETTLSIRNVNLESPIYVSSVKYFDTSGKLASTFVDRLIKLEPLQTIEFLVERRDSSGGSGANFLVDWMAKPDVDHPLIETVMVGVSGTQGISFGRVGVEVTPARQ